MHDIELKVPESLRAYHHQNKLQGAAIDQVLAKSGASPSDFGWDDLSQFYQAWISAEITRYDNWEFLLRANRAIWGEAIPDFNGRVRECDPQYYDRENTVEIAWSWQCQYRTLVANAEYATNASEALLGCWIQEGYLRLWFWAIDNSGSYPTDRLDLSSLWEAKSYDHERHTHSNLKTDQVHLSNQSIDISNLRRAADEVLSKFEGLV